MLRGRDLIWMAERMQEKDRLWDIGEIDVDPKMEMQDKAEVFSEQIESNSNQDDNAGIFVNLFGRLDPLSAKRRETKTEFSLYDALCGAVAVFDKECKDNGIQIDLDCSKDIKLIGWKQDIYTIMVNLLDNSLLG